MFVGIVDSYDESRGVGTIEGYGFHCTAISDGTRVVMPGTVVAYSLVPGHFGVMEPYPVVKIDQGGERNSGVT